MTDLIATFASLSLLASCGYVINDLKDRERDRQNPLRASRPLACGKISPRQSALLMLATGGLGACAALQAPAQTHLWLLAYLALSIGYSLSFKRVRVVGVCTIGVLFVIRLEVGAAATLTPHSFLLDLFVFSMACFIVNLKRRGPIGTSGDTGSALRWQSASLLLPGMSALGALSHLHWQSGDTDPVSMLAVLGLTVAWLCNHWRSFRQGKGRGDPTRTLLEDPLSLLLGIALVLSLAGSGH